MNISFVTRPFQGFLRFLGLIIFPRKVHLVYGTGGKSVGTQDEIKDHLSSLKVKLRWYILEFKGIWYRPNQVIMIISRMSNTWQADKMIAFAKKYNIQILYFKSTADLKTKVTKWATN